MLKVKKYLTVKEIIEIAQSKYNIKFRVYATEKGLQNKVRIKAFNRPGLTLSGYFKNFAYRRIQIFGKGENSYLNELGERKKRKIFEKFLSYKIPLCIFSYNFVQKTFLSIAMKNDIPVLITKLSTAELEQRLKNLLNDYLSPSQIFHGVMVEVFGVGILITGKSGVGKSEAALDLVSKGHRLIADDVVIVKKFGSSTLIATGIKMVKYYMEIRGLGIIDIKNMFGTSAIMESKQVDLIVELEEWNSDKEYERIGIEEKYKKILDVKVPQLVIPVKPGRNIPVIIETAARDKRARTLGYNSALILNKTLKKKMKNG